MDNPWKCPSCGVWNAPGVTSHRCDDGSCLGGGAIIVSPRPISPAGFWRCGVCQSDVPANSMHSCGGFAPTGSASAVDIFAGKNFVVS